MKKRQPYFLENRDIEHATKITISDRLSQKKETVQASQKQQKVAIISCCFFWCYLCSLQVSVNLDSLSKLSGFVDKYEQKAKPPPQLYSDSSRSPSPVGQPQQSLPRAYSVTEKPNR